MAMNVTYQERMRHIRSAMVDAGVTNAEICREQKISPTYFHYVLTGQRKGYRIRLAVALKVGKPVETLWPDTPPEYRKAA